MIDECDQYIIINMQFIYVKEQEPILCLRNYYIIGEN